MKLILEKAALEKKNVLTQMLELYRYDFSEFDGSDLNENGQYGYAYLDAYWQEEGRYPFFIKADNRFAGFVLVHKTRGTHMIAEFFVMKKYRKMGIGRQAAFLTFDRFPGKWDVAQIPKNKPAQSFWVRIIRDYTNGEFTDQFSETEQVRYQTFVTSKSVTREAIR
ncbi:GNAT family N-acetyltransferase [Fictibacillus fluitans]|uniref:GNAT family N-acetyltransferase n=1 Tax=Fictibacillus fluitans TaxID=3058422 RepID=A0ABT8HWK8_9BACL|nr:GNAT family N-acetyltransferase [Fictibacillus sp. NE201]MDN4525162.1 GNAT family N-acetyltransferase [Fictibacillus sp. NE201]